MPARTALYDYAAPFQARTDFVFAGVAYKRGDAFASAGVSVHRLAMLCAARRIANVVAPTKADLAPSPGAVEPDPAPASPAEPEPELVEPRRAAGRRRGQG